MGKKLTTVKYTYTENGYEKTSNASAIEGQDGAFSFRMPNSNCDLRVTFADDGGGTPTPPPDLGEPRKLSILEKDSYIVSLVVNGRSVSLMPNADFTIDSFVPEGSNVKMTFDFSNNVKTFLRLVQYTETYDEEEMETSYEVSDNKVYGLDESNFSYDVFYDETVFQNVNVCYAASSPTHVSTIQHFIENDTVSVDQTGNTLTWTFTMPDNNVFVGVDYFYKLPVLNENECMKIGLKPQGSSTITWYSDAGVAFDVSAGTTIYGSVKEGYFPHPITFAFEDGTTNGITSTYDQATRLVSHVVNGSEIKNYTKESESWNGHSNLIVKFTSDQHECSELSFKTVKVEDFSDMCVRVNERDYSEYTYHELDTVNIHSKVDTTIYAIDQSSVKIMDGSVNVTNNSNVTFSGSDFTFTIPDSETEDYIVVSADFTEIVDMYSIFVELPEQVTVNTGNGVIHVDGWEYKAKEGSVVTFTLNTGSSVDTVKALVDGQFENTVVERYTLSSVEKEGNYDQIVSTTKISETTSTSTYTFTMPSYDVRVSIDTTKENFVVETNYRYLPLEYNGHECVYFTSLKRGGTVYNIGDTFTKRLCVQDGDEVTFRVEAYRPSNMMQYIYFNNMSVGLGFEYGYTSRLHYGNEFLGTTKINGTPVSNYSGGSAPVLHQLAYLANGRPEYNRSGFYFDMSFTFTKPQDGSLSYVRLPLFADYNIPRICMHVIPSIYNATEVFYIESTLNGFSLYCNLFGSNVAITTASDANQLSEQLSNEVKTYPHGDFGSECGEDRKGYCNYIMDDKVNIKIPTDKWYFDGPLDFYLDCEEQTPLDSSLIQREGTTTTPEVWPTPSNNRIAVIEQHVIDGGNEGYRYMITDTSLIPKPTGDRYYAVLKASPRKFRMKFIFVNGGFYLEVWTNYPKGRRDTGDYYKILNGVTEETLDIELNSKTHMICFRDPSNPLVSVVEMDYSGQNPISGGYQHSGDRSLEDYDAKTRNPNGEDRCLVFTFG